MRVDFTRTPGQLQIKEGIVQGPVIGATIEGNVDFARNDVRMRGTIVPLYGINNPIGQLPLLGAFLGGPKEGLFGFTYQVVGPPSAPTLNVNPASGLVPGFLRKFFEYPTARPMEPAELRCRVPHDRSIRSGGLRRLRPASAARASCGRATA